MTVSMAANGATSPAFGDHNPQENKFASGFTPLPPIRRTSTFDLLSRKKLTGDEDDRDHSPVGSSDSDLPPVPPMENGVNYQNGNGNGHVPIQAQSNEANFQLNQSQNFSQPPPQEQHPAFANGAPPNPNGFAAGSGALPLNGFQQQMFMGRDGEFGQIQGQPSTLPMHNNPDQPFISQMGGNPVQKFPLNGRWKLEESHLTEPLIQHKSRLGSGSPPQQRQPGYYAYDKEAEDPLPRTGGQSSSQARPKNNSSSSIPPVSAERFRNLNLFAPHAPEQSQAVPPPHSEHPLLRGRNNDLSNSGERGSHDAGPRKEMDVHVDEVSVSSVTSEEQPPKGRRGSAFFGLGPRRNTGAEQSPQNSDKNASAKEFQSNKSNLSMPKAPAWEQENNPEHVSMRKRLSELTGMIKGVGNAKDGAKDDQPAKPSPTYPSRPSMQGPPRSLTAQGSLAPPGPLGPSPLGAGRSRSSSGPRPIQAQQIQGEDDHEKKHSGGFLGGLFNKQGSKASESKQSSQQTAAPGQRPPPQFRPGPMPPPPGQTSGPHPMYTGQPPNQPGQQGLRHPALTGQPNPLDHVLSPISPQFLGTAQAVVMRRPSEITVSSQSPQGGTPLTPAQRHQFPSQRGPPANIRPSTAQGTTSRNMAKQPGGEDGFPGLVRDSPRPVRRLSQEQIGADESSFATRTSPNRKPVGSGTPKMDGGSNAPSPMRPDDTSPQSEDAEDENRRPGQLPSGQQSPTLGKLGHVRQTSLPSPGRPSMLSQSGQMVRPISPQDRQDQSHENPQGQFGMTQLSPDLVGYHSFLAGPIPQHHHPRQDPQAWGPNVSFADQQPGPHTNLQGPPRRPVGNIALPPEQHRTISKFFGLDNGKPVPVKESKEKSAASKLLGAFKRSSKQSDPNQSQQKYPPSHPHARNMLTQPSGSSLSQQVIMARPPISDPSPKPGPLGPMTSPPRISQPGVGRGMPVPRVIPGQPFHPMMSGGRGGPPLQIQAGRGQNPQIVGLKLAPGQQRRRSAQGAEPQYAQVPIPRGYEAVHGYGNAGMIAPSPYDVGRPSPPPGQQPQYQAFAAPGVLPQQWDLRMIQIPGQGLQLQSNQRENDSESSTPSDQGTFLDMAPTPPLRRSHEGFGFERQPSQQTIGGPQGISQPSRSLDIPTPSSANWGSIPDSVCGPQSQKKPDGPVHGTTLQSKPSDTNMSPPSDDDIQRNQQQHIATALNNNASHTSVLQPGPTQDGHTPNATRHLSPNNPPSNQSSPIIQEPENQTAPADPNRLVSKISANPIEPSRNASLSPDVIANRAASVSPEPPALSRQSPYHQVSNTSLNINVERANDAKIDGDEDIYDATPRMDNQGSSLHDNTKYAGSERGRPLANGTGATTSSATASVIFTVDPGDDSPRSAGPTPEQEKIPMTTEINREPEEKILVDQPVELAAVNDDDDGIPVMTATSYPGQEWNPYGAGEFNDWD